jgi:hypothetical protein
MVTELPHVAVFGKRGSPERGVHAVVFVLKNVAQGEGIDRAREECDRRGVTYLHCVRCDALLGLPL